MTEQLQELLHVEATRLEVPPLRTHEIVGRGRVLRRRRRAVAGVAVLAALAVVGAGVATVVSHGPGTRDAVPFSPSGFDEQGALAVDSQLYVAGERVPLRGAVKSFLYTSDGVVVRSGTSPWTDDPDVDHYTLVSADGSRTQVDLTTHDRVVATEPDSRHLAYASANGDRWDLVVLDLQTGNELSRTTVDGTFTWGGWEAPPVALDGDRVWAHFDGGWTEVDWRTGSTREVPWTQRVYEMANGNAAVQGRDGTWVIRAVATGEELGRVRLPKGWYGTFSPDGSRMKFFDQDDGAPGSEGTPPFVYDIDTGEHTTIPGHAWDYGWTPGGDLLTIDHGEVKTCRLPGGQCFPTGLSVQQGSDSTLKLGGNDYES